MWANRLEHSLQLQTFQWFELSHSLRLKPQFLILTCKVMHGLSLSVSQSSGHATRLPTPATASAFQPNQLIFSHSNTSGALLFASPLHWLFLLLSTFPTHSPSLPCLANSRCSFENQFEMLLPQEILLRCPPPPPPLLYSPDKQACSTSQHMSQLQLNNYLESICLKLIFLSGLFLKSSFISSTLSST